MVAWGGYIPVVPEDLIRALQARTDETGCIFAEHRGLVPGQAVRVTDGPFHDLVGKFCDYSREERVVVLLSLLQREHRVELDAEWVAPV